MERVWPAGVRAFVGQLIKMLVRQREAISPWGSFLARQPTSVTSAPPALTGSPVLSLKKTKANSAFQGHTLGFTCFTQSSFPALAQGYRNVWLHNKNKHQNKSPHQQISLGMPWLKTLWVSVSPVPPFGVDMNPPSCMLEGRSENQWTWEELSNVWMLLIKTDDKRKPGERPLF